jgi:hypothetical protein
MALKQLFSDEPWPQGGRTLGEIIERLATLGFDALVLGDAPCLTLTPPPIRATQRAPLAHRGQISA